MYCPKCDKLVSSSEKFCPDCNTPLLRNKSDSNHDDFVKICTSVDIGHTAIIKSLLNSENITFIIKGEHMQSLLGTEFIFAMGANIGKVEFLVKRKDKKKALEILQLD